MTSWSRFQSDDCMATFVRNTRVSSSTKLKKYPDRWWRQQWTLDRLRWRRPGRARWCLLVAGSWIARRRQNRRRRRVTSRDTRADSSSSRCNPTDLVTGVAAAYLIFTGRYCITARPGRHRGFGVYTVYRILRLRVDGAAFQRRRRAETISWESTWTAATRYRVISVANDWDRAAWETGRRGRWDSLPFPLTPGAGHFGNSQERRNWFASMGELREQHRRTDSPTTIQELSQGGCGA